MNLYMNGLESAIKSAKTIVLFLTQRYSHREMSSAHWLMLNFSGRARLKLQNLVMKPNTVRYSITLSPTSLPYCFGQNGLPLDYCLESLAKSWWVLYYLPELAFILLKVGSLDDVKTNQSDTGAARSMALDHLGVIASRLRSVSLKFGSRSSTEGNGPVTLKPMEEVSVDFLLRRIPAYYREGLFQSQYFWLGCTGVWA